MAEEFRSLHKAAHILVLPNAWDVPSARVFEDAGFPAVATSSAALAVSLGYPDGQRIGKDELFTAVKKIASKIAVPLSVDIESGFGATKEELSDTIRRVIASGGVGINLEDISNFETKTLLTTENQVERIKTVKSVANSLGIPLVINARTDAYHFGTGEEKTRVQDAIRRVNEYAAADADCLYPLGITEKESILTVLKSVRKPINVMARKGVPTIPELEKMGVKRLSIGPDAMYATMGLLRRIAQELRQKGNYNTLLEGAITFDELNALAERKHS
jgi:2-methylisocitrate lyase-like PEP mutase family enzyme